MGSKLEKNLLESTPPPSRFTVARLPCVSNGDVIRGKMPVFALRDIWVILILAVLQVFYAMRLKQYCISNTVTESSTPRHATLSTLP